MLRRSFLELARHRRGGFVRNVRRPVAVMQEVPRSQCRQEFSTVSRSNGRQQPGSKSNPAESRSKLSAVLIGSAVVGSVVMAAYSTGYLDGIIVKGPHGPVESEKINDYEENSQKVPLNDDKVSQSSQKEDLTSSSVTEDSLNSISNVENPEISSELENHDGPVDQSKNQTETISPAENEMESNSMESDLSLQEELPKPSQGGDAETAGNQIADSKHLLEEKVGQQTLAEKTTMAHDERAVPEDAIPLKHDTAVAGEFTLEGESKGIPNPMEEPPTQSSLLDAYHLGDEASGKPDAFLTEEKIPESTCSTLEPETSTGAMGDSSDAYVSKDGKLIMDFLQAIHAAEQRQAELDARVFAEEKRTLREKYGKELKDARARALMYAEEVAMLDKEIKKERAKAAAALKTLQERAEERLKLELKLKEKDAELKLKEVVEFAKAELVAAIAKEKASQIAKMEEANLNIDALCMAFYARSEEARQTNSIHKLALGALALEDAVSNGLPIQRELDALRQYLKGVDKDSLLDLALSSLPEDTLTHGADTIAQLNDKFNVLKADLRHFSMLPPGGGGGGLLANAVAHVASSLKVKEASQSGDGIESVISRVEGFLAEGRVAEAADTLESCVRGSAAAEIVSEWVRRARNRAITEQALTLLQSYVTSVSVSLA